jgi:hypothetical protein
VEPLLLNQCLHEGNWKLLLEFGFSATEIDAVSEAEPRHVPAAFNLVGGIGIMRTKEKVTCRLRLRR